ncbi:MAG: flagellar biosynthetic protein FliO [Pseudomonadales bacterium]
MLHRLLLLAKLLALLLVSYSVFADQTYVAQTGVAQAKMAAKVKEIVTIVEPPSVASPSMVAAPSVVVPGPQTSVPGVGTAVVTAEPFTVVLGLLSIILLIFGLAWLLRRMGAVSMIAGQAMQVVTSLSVGPREKVVLVDVGGQQVLLGVTPGRVSHLQSFDQPVINLDSASSGEFSSKIKQLLRTADSTRVAK